MIIYRIGQILVNVSVINYVSTCRQIESKQTNVVLLFFSVNLNTESFIRSIYYDICMFIFLSIVNRYCMIVSVIKSN